MQIDIRDLPVTRDIDLPAAFVREALAGMPMRAALERPDDDPQAGAARAHVELYEDSDGHVFARGSIDGWFEVACSRCLGTVRVTMTEPIMVTFVPKDQLPEDDTEQPLDEEGVELSEEDLDLYGYEGETIDLEPLLREQIVLAVPFAPLCSELCKGLCPQCGIDRNREECACEPPIDPRLATLKNIKI